MAISCSLNKSILRTSSCGYSLNSVKDLYLANREDIESIDYAETGEVENIALKAEAKFSHIMPATDSASFTDALTKLDGGGSYRTQTISFKITGDYTPAMVAVVDALSLGEFVGVARLASGVFVMLGSEAVGLTADTVTNTGAATASDFSGIEVVLSGDLTVSSAPLSEAAITAMEGNIYEALK
jgi:hypothetical protein